MALAPKFAGQAFSAGISPKAIHTLELYLDYVCPFSARMFLTIHASILALLREKYAQKLRLIFRQQIQPWHPSSTLAHEAGPAVLRVAPERFWDFSAKLFEEQERYFDVSVVDETRNETYRRLAGVAGRVGIDEAQVFGLLEVRGKEGGEGGMNGGNGVTDDVKVMVKANRLTGVHVTPTVLFNGVVENSISSTFTVQQWEEWLEKNVL